MPRNPKEVIREWSKEAAAMLKAAHKRCVLESEPIPCDGQPADRELGPYTIMAVYEPERTGLEPFRSYGRNVETIYHDPSGSQFFVAGGEIRRETNHPYWPELGDWDGNKKIIRDPKTLDAIRWAYALNAFYSDGNEAVIQDAKEKATEVLKCDPTICTLSITAVKLKRGVFAHGLPPSARGQVWTHNVIAVCVVVEARCVPPKRQRKPQGSGGAGRAGGGVGGASQGEHVPTGYALVRPAALFPAKDNR
jgi:hypothetical protein